MVFSAKQTQNNGFLLYLFSIYHSQEVQLFPLRINITLALVAVSLVACGGSDNSTTSSQNTDDGSVLLYGAKVATTAATLPTCDSNQVGQLFYVLADQKFQFCSSKGYQSIDLSGAAGADGADGADGKDGASGTNGTNGSDGADGSSCSVISNASDGKTIACADGTTATVNDGESCTVVDNGDGSYDLICSGTTVTVQDGKDGTSCTVSDDNAGTLTQTCTDGSSVSWPKALCGTLAYEPETHFCGAGAVLELCGGASYDATTHFCNAATSAPMAAWSTYCLVAGNCGTFTDTRDTPAKTYKWTKIGTQTWMAENLAYLPSVNARADASSTVVKYYVYNYDGTVVANAKASSDYTTYGVLYNWPAALAVCPTGWHLPSKTEWTTLETFVGGTSTAGTQLKSVYGWIAGGDTGTDAYGFFALPGGNYIGSVFSEALSKGYWWTATEDDDAFAYLRGMDYDGADVGSYLSYKKNGFSVRCVQD